MKDLAYPREVLIKRLFYRSWYRGCKETDKILGNFAKAHLESLSDAELYQYEALLDEQDWDIWAWLTGKEPIPERINTGVMQKLLTFKTHESLADI